MAGGAPVAMLLGNGPGIPLAYVVVSVILLIFSVGYTAMARHHTSTGAFYSFVARGLRQPAGARSDDRAARLQRHADRPLRPVRRPPRRASSATISHINLPWWVFAFVAMAIIAVLGYRQVDLSVKVLSILVSLEFLIVLILDAAILIKGGEGGTAPLTATPSPGRASPVAPLRSRCCSTSRHSSASRPPRSTARRLRIPSAQCHGQPMWRS